MQIHIERQTKCETQIQIQIQRGWVALGRVAWVGIMAGHAHRKCITVWADYDLSMITTANKGYKQTNKQIQQI